MLLALLWKKSCFGTLAMDPLFPSLRCHTWSYFINKSEQRGGSKIQEKRLWGHTWRYFKKCHQNIDRVHSNQSHANSESTFKCVSPHTCWFSDAFKTCFLKLCSVMCSESCLLLDYLHLHLVLSQQEMRLRTKSPESLLWENSISHIHTRACWWNVDKAKSLNTTNYSAGK